MKTKRLHPIPAHAHVVVTGPDYYNRCRAETPASAAASAEDIRDGLNPEYAVAIETCQDKGCER